MEGEFDRKDVVFPHALRGVPPAFEFYDNLRRTPFADEILLGLATAIFATWKKRRHEAALARDAAAGPTPP